MVWTAVCRVCRRRYVFGGLRTESAPVTVLDLGGVAPVSLRSQTLVGCHRTVHVSAGAAHRCMISPGRINPRWLGRWAASSNTAPTAAAIQSAGSKPTPFRARCRRHDDSSKGAIYVERAAVA